MSEERSYEQDSKILNSATTFPWHHQENDDCWQLFGGYNGNMQLIKAPKHGTDYAEYWPEPEDTELIVEAPDAWRYWMEKSRNKDSIIKKLRSELQRAEENFKDIQHSSSHSNAVFEQSLNSASRIHKILKEY